MAIFNNGESGLSVRTKINEAINKVDGATPISSINIDGGTIDGVVVGGTSAAAATFTNTNLAAIAESKAVTAVDVFVYDTSKDSDGGAWRKRTQNTSWYNETLNTATRGSRREFPAVAVIVAEAAKVTIYDGDDPALPMWMVFDGALSTYAFRGNGSAVTMLGGSLVIGTTDRGVQAIDFPSDDCVLYTGSLNTRSVPTIIDRNQVATFTPSGSGIVNNNVNDVAMTVLPDAPIDPATGLPVPTIAVATAGGYSQIGWDGVSTGNVWDAASTQPANKVWNRVAFTDSNQVVANLGYEGNLSYGCVVAFDVLTADVSYSGSSLNDATSQTFGIFEVYNGRAQPVQLENYGSGTLRIARLSAGKDSLALETTLRPAVAFVARNPDAPATGMHALLTSTYNTGYMPADIKGAFLADTSATALVGSGELVTNGTFDTDISGWTDISEGTGSIAWNASGYIDLTTGADSTNEGRAEQIITTVPGQTYVVQITRASGASMVNVGTTSGSQQLATTTIAASAAFETLTFTATTTTTYIGVRNFSNVNATSSIDNISVKLADADRSVNNKGLIVNGTVTRTAVATGAELVAYSGFSAANYLEQPYNADLDFGTGDFSVMGWINEAANSAVETILCRGYYDAGWSGPLLELRINSGGTLSAFVSDDGYATNDTVASTSVIDNAVWTHFALVRRGSSFTLYINSNSEATTTLTNAAGSLSNANANLQVGYRQAGDREATNASLALLRISATAPTAEQIKKIYEDEKFLFQENAACTLYGASDAVTALAHDDSTQMLHVGTSAGRSVFQGLRRVSNTTTAVGTAISASNSLVVEE